MPKRLNHLQKINRALAMTWKPVFGEIHLTREGAEAAGTELAKSDPKHQYSYRYDLVEQIYRVYKLS